MSKIIKRVKILEIAKMGKKPITVKIAKKL